MSPTSLGLGLYYGIPKPSSASSFDATQTRQILFNTSERRRQQSLQYTPDLSAEAMAGVDEGGTVLTPETPASAVPQWVRSTGIQDLGNAGLIIPSNTGADGVPKTTLRGMALYQRTASAWPRYLSDHPEEKELEKTDQDLFFRVLDDLRKKEAEETGGKVLGWDDEFEVSRAQRQLGRRAHRTHKGITLTLGDLFLTGASPGDISGREKESLRQNRTRTHISELGELTGKFNELMSMPSVRHRLMATMLTRALVPDLDHGTH